VSSGLGGMSGAQGKAGVISNAIAVIAEVNEAPLKKRHEQGWIDVVINDIPTLFDVIRKARKEKSTISIGYHVSFPFLQPSRTLSDVRFS